MAAFHAEIAARWADACYVRTASKLTMIEKRRQLSTPASIRNRRWVPQDPTPRVPAS